MGEGKKGEEVCAIPYSSPATWGGGGGGGEGGGEGEERQ